MAYVNADEIARNLSDLDVKPSERDVRAGRLMLREIDRLVQAGSEFMFETTLASLAYAAKIPHWRTNGYHVGLVYLRLPNVEASIDRVRRRVAALREASNAWSSATSR